MRDRKRGRKPRAWLVIGEVVGAPHPGFATPELALAAAWESLYQFSLPLLSELFSVERERVVDVSAVVNGSVAVDGAMFDSNAIVNHFDSGEQILIEGIQQ